MVSLGAISAHTGGAYQPPLHIYHPLIKTAHTIWLFVEENHLVARSEACEYNLPVYSDCPDLEKWDPARIKSYCSLASAMVKKKAGQPHYVWLSLGLPGGMFDQADILPSHSGYAIGNVIHEDDLLLPKYQRRMAELTEQILSSAGEIENEKQIKPKEKYALKQQQTKVNQLQGRINKAERECIEISAKMDVILSRDRWMRLDKTLPMDDGKSKIKLKFHASLSEKLDYFILDSGAEADSRLAKLIAKVFSKEGSSSYLPPGTLASVAEGIASMLKSESRVFVIGSLITLARSKVLDPVVLRENAQIDEDWKQNSNEYFVLTEAVLGGLFLAYGKEILGSEKIIEEESDFRTLLSQAIEVSVISQGAIPNMGVVPKLTNLWNAYTSWKEALQNDRHSGYPIGYRYRKLKDILSENRPE